MRPKMQPKMQTKAFGAALTASALFLTPSGLFAQESSQEGGAYTAGLSGPIDVMKGRPYSPYANRAFPTDVFFGDTHVHTALSPDAGGAGTTLGPRDAYRYARGDQVTTSTGQPNKVRVPYDFFMITDHSDAMGVIQDIMMGTPEILADPDGKKYHEDFNAGGQVAGDAMWRLIEQFGQGELPEALNYQPGLPAFDAVWYDIVDAAEEFNDPGKFTTFIAFEWTSLEKGNNLHRNVILRDGGERAKQVIAYTTQPPMGSNNPRDLWKWMQNYEDTTGGDVLAIPHNGNLSNGMMFAMQDDFDGGAPYDPGYAEQRQKWERLYEATQMKGDGEAHPFLSPDDAFADFETWDYGNLDATAAKTEEMLPGEYARSGLLRGMVLEEELGTNPFKFGMVGAGDNHVAVPSPDNDNFFGKYATYEPSAHRIIEDGELHVALANEDLGLTLYSYEYITSGLTAVWAQENTRGALFDAMQRREVYATTGTRIRVRFFGGWDYAEDDALRRDLALVGYTKGVPMGSDMPPAPEGAEAPSFLVYALRDSAGANLDRVQVVKGWIDAEGTPQEKVYDVAWSDDRTPAEDGTVPPVGSTVDLSIPSWTNTIGAAELGTVWTDPDFDPALKAFYYARVIEIPTPRWTAYDAVKFDLELPEEVPMTNQQRAYTSPIWYTPAE
ncbi:hypothetical protein AYJ57_18185 [Salipiger sp. CCB-MM3]|uniref:DUF3604 domain-containing protein n=1 Tax=Salipiger sp. CCB-MM3 TaxID=1792508 RepID=UPI00080ABE5F|nr:DUF3604 domain-containing protein [Salipiger sp. CCB-MM3]ANT62344.1 hypothetical protein AYJ57_18185 [Salipiger sp. CCB-MM3]